MPDRDIRKLAKDIIMVLNDEDAYISRMAPLDVDRIRPIECEELGLLAWALLARCPEA